LSYTRRRARRAEVGNQKSEIGGLPSC